MLWKVQKCDTNLCLVWHISHICGKFPYLATRFSVPTKTAYFRYNTKQDFILDKSALQHNTDATNNENVRNYREEFKFPYPPFSAKISYLNTMITIWMNDYILKNGWDTISSELANTILHTAQEWRSQVKHCSDLRLTHGVSIVSILDDRFS